MSAIYGIVHRDGRPVDPPSLTPMSETMAHRGSDDQGVWIEDSVGIGHRMMQTTPESLHEKLPFQDNESGLVISSDARIDNRTELGEALDLARQINDGIPDSQLILSAYKKWGESCVDHLLGDFAFVIWDRRRKLLFCARDHMGVKPFNYYADHNRFVFATEVQAILKAPGVPGKINEGRIADFLVTELEGIDKTSTFFENIFRLPPAHTLVVTGDKTIKSCYWQPDSDNRITLNSDSDYVSAFNEIYTDAVRKRLRSNNDAASMLSGGMDSSSIVGIARDLHLSTTGKPFPVFAAVSDNNQDCRETHFINTVLDQGGLSATTVSVEQLGSLNEEINRIVKAVQEPFDPMILIIAIYLLAGKSGYRVMLDGIDGDMIASLSPSYPAILLRDGNYRAAMNTMLRQNRNYYGGRSSTSKILYQNIRAAYTPLIFRKLKNTCRKPGNPEQSDQRIISDEFAKKIDLAGRLKRLHAHRCNGLCQSTYTQHISTILHPYLTVGIERYDRVAALCGIEPRHPLLDKRLVDFMVAIPWDQKVRSGWSKYLLRSASEQVLPREVCWRRGGEHIGGEFGRKWLQLNSNEVATTIGKVLEDFEYLLNASRIESSIHFHSNSDAGIISCYEENLLILNYIGNWFKNFGGMVDAY